MLRIQQYPPDPRKALRKFQLAEVGDCMGVTQTHHRQLHSDGKRQEIEAVGGRRYHAADQMLELRVHLEDSKKSDESYCVPNRREGKSMQVVSAVNFKSGSGKTTTATYLLQYLALTGYRLLAVGLDPQAYMTFSSAFSRSLMIPPLCMRPFDLMMNASQSPKSSNRRTFLAWMSPSELGSAGI
ncbi:nucleotide-binding protein [Agrobacterium pusense]|uniref:nucleotide-binding protein n=1 Tax=Agrobacterium pusense TaxID=648995 RepID=UPI003FD00820